MISKFCPAGHLILIFVKRISPPPRRIWAFQGVNHFSNKYSSTVYAKSALDSVGQFFLKMMLGGQKNFWGESTMDDAMYLKPDKYILGFLNSG